MNKPVFIVIIVAAILIGIAVGFSAFLLIDNLEKSTEQPSSAAALLDLGEKYLHELDYEQALVQFLKAIEVEPMNPRGYTGAAEAYVGLGDTTSAEEILKQGLALLPDNAQIQKRLVELESEIERAQTSIQQYLGVYSTNHREDRGDNPEYSAGYDLEIYSIRDDEITFRMSYIGNHWSPIYDTGEITAPLKDNVSDFQWTDSWGNEGYGTLRLEDGEAVVRMIQTVSAELNRASFDTGDEILLTPYDMSAVNDIEDFESSVLSSLVWEIEPTFNTVEIPFWPELVFILDNETVFYPSTRQTTEYVESDFYFATGGMPPPDIWMYDEAKDLWGHYGTSEEYTYPEYTLLTRSDFEMFLGSYGFRAEIDTFRPFRKIDSEKVVFLHEVFDSYNEKTVREYDFDDAYIGEEYAVAYGTTFITDFIYENVLFHNYFEGTNLIRHNLVAVSLNGKFGIMDTNGTLMIPYMFDDFMFIDSDTAFTKYEGKYGILDISRTLANY